MAFWSPIGRLEGQRLREHTLTRLPFASLILVGCVAGGDAMRPPVDFPFATVSRDCGPADGPAVAIYLTPTAVDKPDPSPPFVRIAIWDSPEAVAGRTWTWPRAASKATALRCDVTGSSCVSSTSGSVTLGTFGPDSALTAIVDVRFSDGARIQGGVRATWYSRRIACG